MLLCVFNRAVRRHFNNITIILELWGKQERMFEKKIRLLIILLLFYCFKK